MSRYRDSVTHRDEADHAQFMAAIAAVAGAIAPHDGGARVTKVALTRRGGGWHNAVHRDLGSNPTVLAAAQVSHRAPAAAIRHAAHALVVHTSARVVHDAATSVARQHEADYRARCASTGRTRTCSVTPRHSGVPSAWCGPSTTASSAWPTSCSSATP